jgi:hypothetical protein
MNGKVAASSVDKVLSLDSAYHYVTREDFFLEAMRCLCPGGRLAVADIILAQPLTSPWSQFCLRCICWMTGIPLSNMCDWDKYRSQLLQAGFQAETISVQFEGQHVFGGFAAYVARQHDAFSKIVHPPLFLKFLWSAALMRRIASSGMLEFVFVVADKPVDKPARAEIKD